MIRLGSVGLTAIAVTAVAIACSSAPKYPACEHDDQCAVSGKHDYCLDTKCVVCRTATDCGDRERCRAGRCEADPDAPPPREAGVDAETDAGDETDADDTTPNPAEDEDDRPRADSPRRVLPQGIRRYLHP